MNRLAVSEFVRIINTIDQSKHRSEVFRDFCELAFCALAKNASPFEEQRQKLEAQYMAVVARYRDKDEVRKMPDLMGIALPQLANGGCDFFGVLAGELNVLDAKMGQFFTPYHVSRLMAEITLSDATTLIEQKGFITLDEPAAGAGGMVLACADFIERQGHDLETSLWVEATELSQSTFHMCYVQLAARGLAGKVFHGNTLSMKMQSYAYLPATPLFLAKHGDPFKDQREEQKHQAEQEAKFVKERELTKFETIPKVNAATQLKLF